MFSAAHTRVNQSWSLIRALYFSFPNLVYLEDILPNAKGSVVYRNTLIPIHTFVAARLNKRRDSSPELLVQFTKRDYENSAWTPEQFVPQRYLDEF